METIVTDSPRTNDISNVSTFYVNTLNDKIFDTDTEADCHILINVDWERKGLNKIACTSMSVPISNYIVPRDKLMTMSVTSGGITKVITIDGSGMVDSLALLVQQINTSLSTGTGALPANFFKYDYDPAYENGRNDATASSNYNAKIKNSFVTGRIWSNNLFTVGLIDGVDSLAPILGLAPILTTQTPISFGGNKYAMPYIADIIPYSIIYLACDECTNGVQSSNGTSILSSIFYNNERNFTYMREDYALAANAKWLTRKTNTLHFYFLDENKKRITDFNGIAAFFTICLFHDSSEPVLR